MDASHIVCFVRSVQNVFQTMLQMHVDVGKPALKQERQPAYDVSGIIGMSGDVEGTVVLSFPTATAERITSVFTGMELDRAHEDFADAVGELVNMVSGGAKAQLQQQINMSCPSVVVGSDHVVFGRKDTACIVIPCSSECGEFAVEVAIRQVAAPAAV